MKTKSRVRIATFSVACLIHAMVLAQGQLTGNVFDLQHQPLPSANVLLLSPTDSTMIRVP
ncbi:hypothetical protein [Chryseolinea lacunae]|uniref:Uncharacterized protein n=1 Tax=Chryseolinea lacunae TaxID=2801331 RepID=A0ABS1L1S5_9BACT|nr:hypothetical protein [Chryseolinea lacunae]MBL0745520.1 hypothetical protein [Chryseolinea lacunae]